MYDINNCTLSQPSYIIISFHAKNISWIEINSGDNNGFHLVLWYLRHKTHIEIDILWVHKEVHKQVLEKIPPNEEKEQMFIVSGGQNPYIGMCQNWKPYHIDFHLAVF